MKILFADDDRVFQLALGRTLPKWGYQPVIVSDGEEAWRRLASPEGPSIAVLDWVMPLADGLEVCRRVRAADLGRYVYIILLTSRSTSEDLMAGLLAGADDYLRKPVDSRELRLRLRAACRVVESESRHRHIAENASDAIILLEEGNRIRFANQAAGAMFGYARAELPGMDFGLLVPGFEQHIALPQPSQEVNGGAGRLQSWEPVELAGKHRTGRSIALDISFSESWHSESGGLLMAMIRDVTERRRLEGQRQQALKLESIGQLAAGIAHEINTPIQYIGDNLQFLRDSWTTLQSIIETQRSADAASPAVDEAELEYLRREFPAAVSQALEGVQHVAGIVRAMREFAHPGTVDMVPADINHLIETAALVSRNRWKYVTDLKMDLDPELPPVPCVAGELSQVMLNLIVNAADAIAESVHGEQGPKGLITITTRAAGGLAEIRVADSGTGIPSAIQARVFDPFFTTKDVGKGTGQGLALAHASIVQKHRGSLDFETTAGAGTTFIVKLPLQNSGPAVAAPDAVVDSVLHRG